MAINKFVHLGEVKMNLTDSTVTPETLAEGVVAYGANGEIIVGTMAGGSGVIEVTELPTENIDTNAFYLCNGEYYKYSSGGNTWVFNDELTLDESLYGEFAFEFEGYADTKNGTCIYVRQVSGPYPHLIYATDALESYGAPKTVQAYCFTEYWGGSVGWLKEEYKTITIKEMPTDEVFLAWLNANAKPASGFVKYVVPSGDVKIT